MLDFDVYREFNEKYDKLVVESLKPYGITVVDILEGTDRLDCVNVNDCRHFFVDGLYAFSIVTEISSGGFNVSGTYKAYMNCRVEVIEEMKGVQYEQYFNRD